MASPITEDTGDAMADCRPRGASTKKLIITIKPAASGGRTCCGTRRHCLSP
jgi:hypothetical protein